MAEGSAPISVCGNTTPNFIMFSYATQYLSLFAMFKHISQCHFNVRKAKLKATIEETLGNRALAVQDNRRYFTKCDFECETRCWHERWTMQGFPQGFCKLLIGNGIRGAQVIRAAGLTIV